ncbi:MAG: S8 family serine peptidase, partial [Thermoplasmata archaeon]|nr:S8 family serine peptidase [Thermoplasmata archaeon]
MGSEKGPVKDRRRWAVTALSVLVSLTMIMPIGILNAGNNGQSSQVIIFSDYSALMESGIEIIESYETFQLASISDAGVEKLRNRGVAVDFMDGRRLVCLEGFQFDSAEGEPDIPDNLRIDGYPPGTEGLYIIQFIGPVKASWLDKLESMGIEIMEYIPNYAYLARMGQEAEGQARELYFTEWLGIYQPAYKISSHISNGHIMIKLSDSANAMETLMTLGELAVIECIDFSETGNYFEIRALAVPDSIPDIAMLDDVIRISQAYDSELQIQQSETEVEILGGGWAPETPYGGPGSLVNLAGWNGSGVMISLCDGGIGDGNPGSGHEDFGERFVGGIEYRDGIGTYWPAGNIAGDGNSHGTHCAGCFGADGSRGTGVQYHTGYYVGMGTAPDCTAFVQRIFSGNWGGPDNIAQWEGFFEDSYDNDVEICTFSWGTGNTEGDYDYQCVAFDAAIRDCSVSTPGDQPLIIFKSGGNDGAKGIVSPGCAKNIILVGGSQNYYPDGTSYGCPQNRNDIDAMYPNSSRGPTADNRIKPDVLAPADYTLSTVSSATSDDGAGYYTSDNRYNWNIGTSFSGPYGAGSGGCVFEWYNATRGTEPSPAMVRACLINCAVDISGSAGGVGDIPNYDEGWGRIYLPDILTPTVNVMTEDADPAFPERFLETGETYSIPTLVVYDDPSEPLKLTLTWVDPAAAEFAPIQLINNLNLKVTAPDGSTTYYGNAFSGGYSQAGTASPWDYEGLANYDSRNNVECVYIAPGELQAGYYTVEVIAENVAADAVASTGELDQDFALVIYNGAPGILPDEPQFDGLTDIKNLGTGTSLNLEWLAGLDYDDEYPLTYHIFRDTSPGLPGSIVLGVSTPHATYSPGGMSPDDPIYWTDTISIVEDTTYYYWVVAQDAGGLAPDPSQLYEDPPNDVEISATAEQLLFFQVQSPAPGQRDLNNDAFEGTIQASTSMVMDTIGDWQVDMTDGQWVSPTFSEASNMDGLWRFYAYGKMNNDCASGTLFASVFRQSDDALMFTTGFDDEDISTFTSDYHKFQWEYTAAGTQTIGIGDAYYVELWLNITAVSPGSAGPQTDYEFTTGGGTDKWYYEAPWSSSPPTGPNGISETELGDYSQIAISDGTKTVPQDAGTDNYAAYKLIMELAEVVSEIHSIYMHYEAGTYANDDGYVTQLYAWNHAASTWLFIDERQMPRDPTDGILSGTLDDTVPGFTQWSDYVDTAGNNRFTWLVFHDLLDANNRQTKLLCDYARITVETVAEPNGQFTFGYDNSATPSAIHQPGEAPTPEYFEIPVIAGWNFISTPLIPASTVVPGVFTDLDGDTTWTYL